MCVYTYKINMIFLIVRLLLPRLSYLPAQIMIQQNSMG